jgi:hypothetical protein
LDRVTRVAASCVDVSCGVAGGGVFVADVVAVVGVGVDEMEEMAMMFT